MAVSGRKLALCLLVTGPWIIPAAAQSTGEELRPELGIYIQQGPQIRVELVDVFSGDQSTHDWRGDFAFYVEAALKPVFRQELRDQPDVFRNKYLVFRAGYRYQTSLTNATSASENRGILELTPRYTLPWQLVISDRNRGNSGSSRGSRFRSDTAIGYGWNAMFNTAGSSARLTCTTRSFTTPGTMVGLAINTP